MSTTTAKQKESPEIALLLSYIGRERQNAVTRRTLSHQMLLPDRQVRELIEQARRCGYFIISDTHGAGYFISDKLEDVEREYRIEKKRALSILSRLKHMRAYLSKRGRPV